MASYNCGAGRDLLSTQPKRATGLPCFVFGTEILTLTGTILVENLKVGEKIVTRDSGIQNIRWIGRKIVPAVGALAPIKIRAGALGYGDTDICLSQNHRLLKTGWDVNMLLDSSEILIAAKYLVGSPGIERETGGTVEYFHILFDNHEIILANGIWAESFHPGQEGLAALADEAQLETSYRFPELLAEGGYDNYGETARMIADSNEVQLLRAGGALSS